MEIEDKSLENAKRRFFISLVFLAVGIFYSLWPVDFIPDFLGPVGWIDDLAVLAGTVLWSARNYFRLKKAGEAEGSSETE